MYFNNPRKSSKLDGLSIINRTILGIAKDNVNNLVIEKKWLLWQTFFVWVPDKWLKVFRLLKRNFWFPLYDPGCTERLGNCQNYHVYLVKNSISWSLILMNVLTWWSCKLKSTISPGLTSHMFKRMGDSNYV